MQMLGFFFFFFFFFWGGGGGGGDFFGGPPPQCLGAHTTQQYQNISGCGTGCINSKVLIVNLLHLKNNCMEKYC